MALNSEIITANEVLKDLSPEQVTAIETLSTNDEKTVIGTRIGQLHQQYDKDILELTGIEKASDTEKSYEYNKRVLSQFKTAAESASELPDKVKTLQSEVENYKKQIAEGNTDGALKQDLADTKTALKLAKDDLSASKQALLHKDKEHMDSLKTMKVDTSFAKVETGLAFKKEYKDMQAKLTSAAKRDVLEKNTPDFIEENGKQVLVFRDAEGEIIRTKENGLAPTTLEELMLAELGPVLEGKKTPAAGAGTTPPAGGQATVTLVDLSSVATQVDADEMIVNHLMQRGLLRGTKEFSEEQTKIRVENKIADLPVR